MDSWSHGLEVHIKTSSKLRKFMESELHLVTLVSLLGIELLGYYKTSNQLVDLFALELIGKSLQLFYCRTSIPLFF